MLVTRVHCTVHRKKKPIDYYHKNHTNSIEIITKH